MRKALIATAALVAAVVFFLLVTLPPAPTVASGLPEPELARRTVGGAYHVHTSRSDGHASRDEVAAAAARAGLQFVIFTDHGDGTEPPAPPAYLHGVLCIDGVEISTNGGHYVALDMARAPYPLGGEADTVVEDVRRLGGFGIAAHPDSAKEPLSWTDWSLGFDGLEWLNADAEWRDEPARRLMRVPFDYVFRPASALAAMLDRPDAVLARWDGIAGQRSIAGLAAHDAHGGVATRLEESQRFGRVGMPSYEASFRAFELRVVVGHPLGSNAEADARRLLEAVRAGRMFTAITALASPAWLEFGATQGGRVAAMGDTLSPDLPATLSVRRPHLPGALTVLVCNGNELERSSATDVAWSVARPGACRVEVRIADAPGAPPIPWIVSNPIYLHPPALEPAAAPGAESIVEMTVPVDSRSLVVEKDAASRATLTATEAGVALDYQLAPKARASQYVALAAPIRAPVPFDRIVFSSRSSRPMRLSVQLRFDDSGGARWGTSVFVPSEPVRLSVPVSRLRAYQPGEPRPDWSKVTGLLLVVDLTNAHPGFEGRLDVSDLALGLAPTPR